MSEWSGKAPLDDEARTALLNPSLADALLTAGALIHWVVGTPDVLARFAAAMEHCPGDLGPDLVAGVLAAVHDTLTPGCPDPVMIP